MPSVPHVRLDSDQHPAGEAFDLWQAALPFYRISLAPGVTRETFRCALLCWFLGDVILSRTDVSAVQFVRSVEQIRADGVDSYSFFVFTSGTWAGDVDGRPLSVGPGQMVGFDLSKPFVAESTTSSGVALSVARTAIGNGLRADPDLHGHVFEGAGAEMLLDHLLSLERHLPSMTEADVARIVALISRLRAGRTILMVEHNLSVVSGLSDRITVLTRGRILAEGDYEAVSTHPDVITAYLGTDHA